jgi:ubiquinone biosynthesis protein
MGPAQALRLLQIQRVLIRYGLDQFLGGSRFYRLGGRIIGLGTSRDGLADRPRGERIRLALEELGPIFVKFGQSLSTRRDLMPRDIADELAKLQDAVPPFPTEQARALAETAYGKPLESLFSRFDEQPIAAASIAQVHGAALQDGREVVVKILRPGVRQQIAGDLAVMYALARIARRYWPQAQRLRPVEVVAEYDKVVNDELDLMREAANAAQLRRNFTDSPLLYVPEVHWDFCRPNVLVAERISGIPIGDVAGLRAAGVHMGRLAATGVEIFFTQVFRHNFFHADMHPGNIFVDARDPANPRYLAVDFGIVGSLSPRDQQYLAENFLAFFNRDYPRIARLHLHSGWVPPDTRIDELESAFRSVCEPIFNRPLKEISFGQFLVRLFTAARRFNMEVQPQLILLQKTLLNIEGLGRELYPELDLWETAQPILEDWMRDRVSGRAMINRLRDQLPEVGETLQEFPQVVHNILQRAADGTLQVEVRVPGLDDLRRQSALEARQRFLAVCGGALLIAGVLWLGLSLRPSWAGWAGSAAGLALMLVARKSAPPGP